MYKPVKDYEDYLIFDDGRVYSLKRNKFLALSPMKTKTNRYLTVELFNKHGSKRKLVHRLVAEAFIPNPDNLPQVNHKDENGSNNHVDNLEWCTPRYNMAYGTLQERKRLHTDYGTQRRKDIARENGKKVSRPVLQFTKDGRFIARYDSGKEASRKTGANHSHILECCAGKRYKTVNGFVWKYEGSVDLLVFQ